MFASNKYTWIIADFKLQSTSRLQIRRNPNGVAAWLPDLIFRDVLFLRFKVL
jgi:hypothetical protein